MTRRLLLLGAGHAHVHVLSTLAASPLAGVETVLVTPYPRQVYSGMVPGWVAGHYDAAQCAIAVEPLAAAAGVRWIRGAAVAIDAAASRVTIERDGGTGPETLAADVVSIDTGATLRRDALPGAADHALFVRPIETFVQTLERRIAAVVARGAGDGGGPRIVVVGGGAAGVELVFALRRRCAAAGPASPRATLLTGGPAPLAGYADGAIRRVERELARQGIAVVRDGAAAIEADAVVWRDGTRIGCDLAVVAIGVDAPRWLAGSGLALDDAGFVRTGPTLQSVSHPRVFAVGDVSSRTDRSLPRSGVFAVRAGAPLAANLRHALAGEPLQPHQPSLRALALVSCGEKTAIAAWGDLVAQGRWAWWWKDRIDRRFVDRYSVDAPPGGVVSRAAGS